MRAVPESRQAHSRWFTIMGLRAKQPKEMGKVGVLFLVGRPNRLQGFGISPLPMILTPLRVFLGLPLRQIPVKPAA
jgi:hypothetical protein